MRQAQDSEIIRLSMWVREGRPLNSFPCRNEQVRFLSPSELNTGVYAWPDQIICATNAKRNYINDLIRQGKGFGPEPCVGDKVISLRNHWEFFSQTGTWALTNGSIGTIEDYDIESIYIPRYISEKPVSYMRTTIKLEDGDKFHEVPIDYQCLTTGVPTLDNKQMFLLNKDKFAPEAPYEFAYAYCITGWKAQGSSWPKVLLYEENFPFGEEHKKFLYTGITRASEKLVVVR